MDFIETLNELMLENNVNMQDISKITKIEDSILYDYMHGALPNVKHSVELANYFDCSLNFLFGLDEQPKQMNFKKTYDIKLFSERYDKLLKENKITHYALSKTIKLNYSSHYAWQHGSIPSLYSLILIAKYFDVSIDYLVGRSDNK